MQRHVRNIHKPDWMTMSLNFWGLSQGLTRNQVIFIEHLRLKKSKKVELQMSNYNDLNLKSIFITEKT